MISKLKTIFSNKQEFQIDGVIYKEKRLLAEGAYAYVYLVKSKKDKQLYALKHITGL